MASTQLSPGVAVLERDLTNVVNSTVDNVAAVVGAFEKGPVEDIVTITSEKELLATFGKPNELNYEYWFTAAQYLAYGGTLKTIRVSSSSLKNAVDTGTAPLIKNLQSYETSYEEANNNWTWAARTAGSKGNSIGILSLIHI